MKSTLSPRRFLLAAVLLSGGCAVAPQDPAPTSAPAAPAAAAAPSSGGPQYSVKAYGAKGDGSTLDTAAINAAIDAAAAAGGGTVYFPAGTYASFSIHLKSHVRLDLGPGSTILAAEPPADLSAGYDAPEAVTQDFYQDFGHSHWHNSLIWGENLVDISIVGPGRIYGRGFSRGSNRRDLLPAERPMAVKPDLRQPPDAARAAVKKGAFGYPSGILSAGIGNKAIALKNCRNVIFRDFTIEHGGHFGILATGVDNWTVDGLKIDTNRDGIDFDCCQNVRVANCAVNSPYDDGICPKSSLGLGYSRPTDNVTITNCIVSGYDEGTMLDGTRQHVVMNHGNGGTGRIKCGTESNGGFRNITISNCVFEYCRGFALESVDGARMEDITVSNLTMRHIANAPIFIRLGARLRGPAATTAVGTARRIKIDNVVAHDVASEAGVLIAGLAGHPIEDLALTNIFIDYVGGGTAAQGARDVPEYENAYPEPSNFKTLPAWGLWARHVKNLTLSQVEFRAAAADLRPTVILDDVAQARLSAVKLPHGAGAAAIELKHATDFGLRDSDDLPDVRLPEASERKF